MGGALCPRRQRRMTRCLLLRLEGPLMAFGDVTVDAHGPILPIPPVSALTGLLANALGWQRHDWDRLARLQRRLRYAVRRDRGGERVRDFQTAQLSQDDTAWTTQGEPLGRFGGAATYESPHIRLRWFDADASLAVAMRLEPPEEHPRVEDISEALARPARPLFLGRKPCLPATPLVIGIVETGSCLEALAACPLAEDAAPEHRMFWMAGEGPETEIRHEIAGIRDWPNNVHAGRLVFFEDVASGRKPA